MKKKIYLNLAAVAVSAILSTMLLITLANYNIFRKQMFENLKSCAQLIRKYDLLDKRFGETNAAKEPVQQGEAGGLRITLIGTDGQVILDSEADTGEMENHRERPEVRRAFAEGEGQAVRRSRTLDRSTFYYAVRLPDGTVLRTAREADSIYSIFAGVMPSLVMITCILILVSFGAAHFLTGKLIAPIKRLAETMQEGEGADYEELKPFLAMIKKQHQDIVESARLRQEFTANVTHELKTPLTSISGYAELIETGLASEQDVVRFATGIHRSADRLLTLINDILRLSELDSSQEMPVERLNLYQLAAACVEAMDMNARKHQVTLELRGEDSFVMGNKQMLEELLYNLCDNAIRYNKEGGSVRVEVTSRKAIGTMERQTVLTVQDTGIGIPKEHQERIFERFYRVDKSRSAQTGGTGLGLAIVKHIISRHNADIELQSEAEKGTTIRIIFPAA